MARPEKGTYPLTRQTLRQGRLRLEYAWAGWIVERNRSEYVRQALPGALLVVATIPLAFFETLTLPVVLARR